MIGRVFAARVASDAAVAGAAAPIPGGTRLRSASLPTIRDLNAALLGPASSDADLAAAVASGAPRITVFRDVEAPEGWRALRLVLMSTAAEHPAPASVTEVGLGDLHAARSAVLGEMIGALDAEFARAGARAFGVRADDGWVAWALQIGGCVDDVYVLDAYRRRGLGRAVTQAALAAGGWFLWCLESDPVPRALYRSLGLTEAGTVVSLTRG